MLHLGLRGEPLSRRALRALLRQHRLRPWPEIAEAAKRQVEELPFFSNWVGFAHEPALELADRLTELVPIDVGRIFFVGGGSEAIESALKIARQYHRLRGEPTRTKFVTPAQRLPRDDARRALDQREPGAARAVRAAAPGLLPRADAVPLPLPVLRGEARPARCGAPTRSTTSSRTRARRRSPP